MLISLLRIYRVNQAFRFDEGIWLHRKSSRQIREKKIENPYITSYVSDLPSDISTIIYTFIRKRSSKERQSTSNLDLMLIQNMPIFLSQTV